MFQTTNQINIYIYYINPPNIDLPSCFQHGQSLIPFKKKTIWLVSIANMKLPTLLSITKYHSSPRFLQLTPIFFVVFPWFFQYDSLRPLTRAALRISKASAVRHPVVWSWLVSKSPMCFWHNLKSGVFSTSMLHPGGHITKKKFNQWFNVMT